MKILFTIGSVPVTLYGAMTALALLCFWGVGCLWLIRRRKDADLTRFVLLTGVMGWLMARVVFVLCNMGYYVDELNGYFAPVLNFWDGGYAMTGAVIGAALGAHLCGRAQRRDAMNAVGLAMPLGIAVLRLAEFLCDTEASGEIGEGNYAQGGWLDDLLQRLGLMMEADGDMVYAACLPGALCALLLFIGLIIWTRRGSVEGGDVLTVSLLLYGTMMLVLEQLRNDGHLIFHFVHIQQVLALAFVLQAPVRWTVRYVKRGGGMRLPALLWIALTVCIGVAVFACFGVDRWENKLLAWTLLILPSAAVAVLSLWLYRKTLPNGGMKTHGA